MEGLTEGRICHFVMADGQHRPAIVVRVWKTGEADYPDGTVQLQVFTDGSNDPGVGRDQGTIWKTSVHSDEETKSPGTWHWIERA